MNIMTYKGYTARIEYSAEDGCLIGEIAGIRDIVSFHGDSVAELQAGFEDAVEDYLEMCELSQGGHRKNLNLSSKKLDLLVLKVTL